MRRYKSYAEIQAAEDRKIWREIDKRHAEIQRSLTEPLWYLKSIPYQQYLQSHHWKALSERFKARNHPLQCSLCGINSVADEDGRRLEWLPQFNVHHISYDRIGSEVDSDLILVCSACHNLIHYPDSAAAKFWLYWQGDSISLDLLKTLNPNP